MVEILPSAIFILPFAIICSFRRKWALFFLALTVPLFDLTVVNVISHQFHPAEIAVISLGINQLYRWTYEDKSSIVWVSPFNWFAIFLSTTFLSIVYLIISPPEISVNQYGVYPGLFERTPVSISLSNITQLLLRVFSIGAIGLIAVSTRRSEVASILRVLVLGGILSVIVGILYQLATVLNVPAMPEVFQWFGTGLRDLGGYGYFGPIPRMGTLSGEPGHTAQYLLYIFTVVLTLALINTQRVFQKENLPLVSGILFILLLATTSSTAYGGILIMISVLVFIHLLVEPFDHARFKSTFRNTSICVLLSIPLAILIPAIKSIVLYQIEKLLFQAGSGSIRLRYFKQTLEILRVRPLLGVGTGSYYPTSLLGTLLGESGLLGTTGFLMGSLSSARYSFSMTKAKLGNYQMSIALTSGLLTVIFTSLVAKSVTSLLSPWFWFAIALPIVLIKGGIND